MMPQIIESALDWAVPFLCGLLATTIGVLFRRILALERGIRELLRSDLVDIHDRYLGPAGPGTVPYLVASQAEEVYKSYTALGGNGVGTQIRNDILEHVTTSPESKERKQHHDHARN